MFRPWRRRASGVLSDEASTGGTPPPRDPSPLPGPASGLYARYADLLPETDGRRTVVIVSDDDPDSPVPELATPPWPARVIVLSPTGLPEWGLEELGVEHHAAPIDDVHTVNWWLRFVGPVDVIVDAARREAEQYDALWFRIFFHLRRRGLYVVDRRRSIDGLEPPQILDMARTAGLKAADLPGEAPERRRRASVHSVRVDADHVVVVKGGHHVLKVREKDADRILAQREPQLRVEQLLSLPGGTLTSAATVHSHESAVPIPWLEDKLTYPEHHLRHYQGDISMISNALLVTGHSALPDSFRHHRAHYLENPVLHSVNGDFARTRPRDRAQRTLEGSYYHLDSENSGHYGHLLTEVMSRLWGWDEAKKQIPDLKAIFRIRHEDERDPALERQIFGAYGISEDDICWVHEPVRLESVVGATPMWHNQEPHYVHPEITRVWDRVRDSLLAQATVPVQGFERSGGRRIFVSRQDITTNRACRNTREVEAFFSERGFDIVYPENHDVAAQAAIFDRAEVIAGFGGSAMFNIVYSRGYRGLILLNHEAYTARNEHLYTVLLGGEVHYFWSTPDIQHPAGGGWSREAYFSPWAFDFARNADTLDDVITTLG